MRWARRERAARRDPMRGDPLDRLGEAVRRVGRSRCTQTGREVSADSRTSRAHGTRMARHGTYDGTQRGPHPAAGTRERRSLPTQSRPDSRATALGHSDVGRCVVVASVHPRAATATETIGRARGWRVRLALLCASAQLARGALLCIAPCIGWE
jgi:hypothetical protein